MPKGGVGDAVRILVASAIHPHRQSHLLGCDHHPRHELGIIIDEITVFDALPKQTCRKIQTCTQCFDLFRASQELNGRPGRDLLELHLGEVPMPHEERELHPSGRNEGLERRRVSLEHALGEAHDLVQPPAVDRTVDLPLGGQDAVKRGERNACLGGDPVYLGGLVAHLAEHSLSRIENSPPVELALLIPQGFLSFRSGGGR